MNKIPELLAPAGNIEAAITAFENGADAVYAGLSRFNARERTENFTAEDYGKLIYYAGNHGKKVYLTFNTLIKENEISDAIKELNSVTRLLPDAIIVQDLGIVKLIRDQFPNIAIHASTQMGVHNSAGVKVAKLQGIERVILERQVTLEELRLIKSRSPLELEVFIHGALCCSLSGVCLFSSWMGGWSGNRGKCKQPCRRRYHSENGNGFFFSTKDLYTLDHIPNLKKAGIDSLKIEGRLRKSDYVGAVVSAYRLMLDDKSGSSAVLSEAKNILSSSLGRKWTPGFFETVGKNIIDPAKLGASGKQCGRVIEVKPRGFSLKTNMPLYLKDKIRIQPPSGDEGPAITITKLSQNGKIINRLPGNQIGFVYCDKNVASDGLVYKISRSVKDHKKLIDSLPVLSRRIDIDIEISNFGIRVIGPEFSWKKEMQFQIALNKPLKTERVSEEFHKVRHAGLSIRHADIKIRGDYFISGRDLRHLRQEFSAYLEKIELDKKAPIAKNLPEPVFLNAEPILQKRTVQVKNCRNHVASNRFMPASDNFECSEGSVICPPFCFEGELNNYRKKIRKLIKNGCKNFRITSLFQLEFFKSENDIILQSHFPVPACNSFAIIALIETGIRRCQLWPELELPVLSTLVNKYPHYCEIITYACLPILQTRAELPVKGYIKDGHGQEFFVEKKDNMSRLYPKSVFSFEKNELPSCSTFEDRSRDTFGFRKSRFNLDRELV